MMNWPHFWVLAAFLLAYAPKVPILVALWVSPEGYDNRHPRDQQAKLTGWRKRVMAAHYNSFETLGIFAAAVALSEIAGVREGRIAALAAAYVLSRCVYHVMYFVNLASLRSTVWFVGFGAIVALLVHSAWH